MRRTSIIGALLLVGIGVVLGATVFRDDIAHATGLAGAAPVVVTNTSANAVPTREQNLDGSGNIKVHEQGTAKVAEQNTDGSGDIKVHEQGTADVHVTNSSLPVALPPVTGGGFQQGISVGSTDSLGATFTASALSIHLNPGVDKIYFQNGNVVAAVFDGPDDNGNAEIILALTRPISFDTIVCTGVSGACDVSWVGNSP